MAYHGSDAVDGVLAADGQRVALAEPNRTLSQVPIKPTDVPSPFASAELDSTSGETETTSNSLEAEFPPRNAVRLIPTIFANRTSLHMEVDFCKPGQEFLVEKLDGSQSSMTMGEVIHLHSHEVESIVFDATDFPNPESPSAMVGAVNLPFAPRAVLSETYLNSTASSIMPFFSKLTRIDIVTSRAVSVASLLEFLHFCPVLQAIVINNNMRHKCILPETLDGITEPNLFHLNEVVIDGLLPYTTEIFLNKLVASLKACIRLETHFYGTTFPVLQHGPALQKIFAPVLHMRLVYSAFSDEGGHEGGHELESGTASNQVDTGPRMKGLRYRLTCSDFWSYWQLNWHWTSGPGVPTNLMHIGLGNPSFEKVSELMLSLHNVRPSYYDLVTVLQPFKSVSFVELSSTQYAPLEVPNFESYSDSEYSAETKSLTGLLCHDGGLPDSSVQPLSEHHAFGVCAAPMTRKLVRLPLLFALKLARIIHTAPSPPQFSGSGSGGKKPYDPLRLAISPSRAEAKSVDDEHLPDDMRELAKIVHPPLLFAMENARAPAARTRIPAHMRGLTRFYYDRMLTLFMCEAAPR